MKDETSATSEYRATRMPCLGDDDRVTMRLVELPRVSKKDTVEMLRAIADEIERGEYGSPNTIVMGCVIHNIEEGSRMIWGTNVERNGMYRLFGLAQHWMDQEDS